MSGILTVIYGGNTETRLSVTRSLALLLPGKTAVVSVEALRASILQPDEDLADELELIHVQLRLLVANFLKAGYHVVAEGAFSYSHEGRSISYDNDIDQLVALMRNLATATKVVALQGGDGVYKSRFGTRYLEFDPAAQTPDQIAASVRDVLRAELNG